MNIIQFNQCFYLGNVKKDFLSYVLKGKKISFYQKIVIKFLSIFSLLSKKIESKFWSYINQQLLLENACEQFFETNKNKINSKICFSSSETLDILSYDAPYFLVKPFLRNINISSYHGYDVDLKQGTLIPIGYSNRQLKQQIRNKKIELKQAIDRTFSFYIFKAEKKYIATPSKIYAVNLAFVFKTLLKNIINCLIMLLLSIFIETFTFQNSSAQYNSALFFSYYQDYRVFLLTLFLILMPMLILYFCTHKIWLSFLLTEIPFFTLAYANYFKLKYRDYPVVFSDLLLLSEAKMMAGKYDITPTLYHLLFILLSIVLILLLKKYHDHSFINFKGRILLAVLLFSSSCYCVNRYVLKDAIYENAGDESVLKNRWIASQQLQRRGVLYAFVYSYKNAFDVQPENYDEYAAKQMLETYSTDNIPDDQKVNIITIMLESYNDFSKFDLNFTEDIYAPFHEICAEGYHGELISNVFGGGTVNTERSYLAGYFNQPLYLKNTNSYVHYFNSQGYTTVAQHPCYGSFYNRRNVNEYLGFDQFYYVENRYGEVSFDDVFFPDIIAEFEKQTAQGKPYFNYSLTYQNHGPYPKEYNDSIPEYLSGYDTVDDATMNGINYYFNGIKNTNEHLKELHDYLQDSDQPTILVLFGDHNPVFGSGSDGFEMLGINMDISTIEGFTNYYSVPYVFWANDAAKAKFNDLETGQGATISPNFLMNELFDYLGWNGNSFMKYTNEIKEKMPVVHNTWKMVGDTYVQDLDASYTKILSDLKNVEYYYYSNFLKQ